MPPALHAAAVDVESVVYLKVDKPKPIVLFEVLKGMATGSVPDVGAQRKVSEAEIEHRKGG